MTARTPRRGRGLIFSPWNLLLLIPLWVLLTPLYNRQDPELFGMPFFYWFQFVGIIVGVTCTSIVYFATRTKHEEGERGE